jgi:hypothetical protein
MNLKDILAFLFGLSMGFIITSLFIEHDYIHAGIAVVAYLSMIVRWRI